MKGIAGSSEQEIIALGSKFELFRMGETKRAELKFCHSTKHPCAGHSRKAPS